MVVEVEIFILLSAWHFLNWVYYDKNVNESALYYRMTKQLINK